jgi:hypothetical protein
MKELLIGLKEVGNEGRQMEALVELCEVRFTHQHFFAMQVELFDHRRSCPWATRMYCWVSVSIHSSRFV